MKCPYNVNIGQKNETTFEYEDGTGNVSRQTEFVFELHMFTDCLKKNCAAWNKFIGGCRYRGNNET